MSKSAILTFVSIACLVFLQSTSHGRDLFVFVSPTISAYAKSRSAEGPSSSERPSFVHPFRMLFGIFTIEAEASRRKLIRKTYLRFHDYLQDANISTQRIPLRYSRICALADVQAKNISRPEECQLLYAFVIGASQDPNAPTERLEDTALDSIVIDRSLDDRHDHEADVTYLNIRENMNDGKTETWFKYASNLPEDLQIDLIVKLDSDTIVYPRRLLVEVERELKSNQLQSPSLVYGGAFQLGKDLSYLQGGCYWLSRTLARYITSQECDRARITQQYVKEKGGRAEDVEISRFVGSYTNNDGKYYNNNISHVHWMTMGRTIGWDHSTRLKNSGAFRDNWKWYLADEIAIAKLDDLREAYPKDPCPPLVAVNATLLQIGKEATRIRQRFKEKVQKLCPHRH